MALRTEANLNDLGRTRFALAQALFADRREQARALGLAAQARDSFRADGKHSALDLRDVEAWLQRHRGG
jgi:hypothetical protein